MEQAGVSVVTSEFMAEWDQYRSRATGETNVNLKPHGKGMFGDSDIASIRIDERVGYPGTVLRQLKYVGRVERFACHNSRVSDDDWHQLRHLVQLKKLDLSHSSISDSVLSELAFPELTELVLSDTAITDAGLANVATWTKLEVVQLDGLLITDTTMTRLATLPELKVLTLYSPQVTFEGYRALQESSPLCIVQSHRSLWGN